MSRTLRSMQSESWSFAMAGSGVMSSWKTAVMRRRFWSKCPQSKKRMTTMNLFSILKVAFRALGRNKLRSALTMLGIIIGVGAVIAMVSIGQGAQSMVLDQINGMGSNMLTVMPGNQMQFGASLGAGASSTLTAEDVEAMLREVPTIAEASPTVRASGQMVFGNQNWFTQIQGANQQFPKIRVWKVDQG